MHRGAILLICLAGCGRDRIVVAGELASGFPSVDRVHAVEASREAAVREGRFELSGLGASPVSLRLLSGEDTVAWLDLSEVPRGSRPRLRGLRLDAASRRAFPDEVAGVEVLTVNGVRIGAPGVAPDRVDGPGAVLAASADGRAMLFRPQDAGPDLRVLIDSATAVTSPDGDPLRGWNPVDGDSLHLSGAMRNGYLRAQRVVVPRHPAAGREGSVRMPRAREGDSLGDREEPRERDGRGGGDREDGEVRGRGRENGRGEGRGGGRGRGKGRG